MAIPKVMDARLVSPNQIELEFDIALDTGQNSTPLSSFKVNYGAEPVTGYSYLDNTVLLLEMSIANFGSSDNLRVSYSPPDDIFLGLRGFTGSLTAAEIRKVAVRAFSSFRVANLIQPTPIPEEKKNLAPGFPRAGATLRATVDDFILAYGMQEAVQVSNIDNPSANTVNEARIRMALEDAESLIDSYVTQAPKAGIIIISSSRRRTTLVLARYFLDSVRRRENVTQDYERAIKELDSNISREASVPTEDLAINNGGILRTWRIPQFYNSVSGKGFDGWFTDTAAKYDDDFREDDVNSQTNNNEDNWARTRRSPRSRPNDTGGTDV
jgi:phage gp36-like protein